MFKSYVQDYGIRNQYPNEAITALTQAAEAIENNPDMRCAFTEAYRRYCADHSLQNVRDIHTLINQKADAFSYAKEPVMLLLFIVLSHHLEELYSLNGLPRRYFDGVMADLLSKLMECHKVKGVWGTFVSDWFIEFFCLERFAIGRLQYNFVTMPACRTPDGRITFNGGEKALTIHIPSIGPLLHDDVEASLQEAADFYADEFEGDSVLFTCYTWLLFAGHIEMLPETSNIRRFRDHFIMLPDELDPNKRDLWRIFGTQQIGDVSTLPRDTGLRRAYAEWLEQGKPVGRARGIRFVKKTR